MILNKESFSLRKLEEFSEGFSAGRSLSDSVFRADVFFEKEKKPGKNQSVAYDFDFRSWNYRLK